MSIRVMSWVWEESPASGSALLLLLAIADHAADDGANAYPSIKALMKKTRMSRSSVFRALKELVEYGWLEIQSHGVGRDTSHYRIIMDLRGGASSGVILTPPEVSDRDPRGVNLTPHPSQNDTSEVSDRHGRGVSSDTSEVSLLTPRTVLEPSVNLEERSAQAQTPPPRVPRSPRRIGSRIPPDFKVTPQMREWFHDNIGNNVNGKMETEKFRNYWSAKTGQGATKLDWEATWRNWMLKASEGYR